MPRFSAGSEFAGERNYCDNDFRHALAPNRSAE